MHHATAGVYADGLNFSHPHSVWGAEFECILLTYTLYVKGIVRRNCLCLKLSNNPVSFPPEMEKLYCDPVHQ